MQTWSDWTAGAIDPRGYHYQPWSLSVDTLRPWITTLESPPLNVQDRIETMISLYMPQCSGAQRVSPTQRIQA